MRTLHIKASQLSPTMAINCKVMQIKPNDNLTLRPLRGEMTGYYAVIKDSEPNETQFYAQVQDILQNKGEQIMTKVEQKKLAIATPAPKAKAAATKPVAKTKAKAPKHPQYEHTTNGVVVELVKLANGTATLLLEGTVEKEIKEETFKKFYRPYTTDLKTKVVESKAISKARPSGKAANPAGKVYKNTGYQRNELPLFDAKEIDGTLVVRDADKNAVIKVSVAPACIIVEQCLINKKRYFALNKVATVLKHIQNNQDINTCKKLDKAFNAFMTK